ncbi:uncharacterized protein PAC_03497 [Phialocephala subalpina]|uniref:Major facilitator superfamily (MFS) profile domain-containing protein n=1 Tax=Phialocephala subalpina TaxID=576137 RepID=A0A1L7WLH0_9HELO|nr:uncharacterized protein PAC_03497 [Phialocephala subalpina]
MLVADGQNIGVLVINNYNTLLYKSLGLSSMQALAIGAAYNAWAAFANVGGAFVSNRLGKRKALLIGYSGAIVMFIIATGLIAKYSENSSESCAAAAVTFLFLYVYFYDAFIDINQDTVTAKIFPSHLRINRAGKNWIEVLPGLSQSRYSPPGLLMVQAARGLALEEIDALFGKDQAVTGEQNLSGKSTVAEEEVKAES